MKLYIRTMRTIGSRFAENTLRQILRVAMVTSVVSMLLMAYLVNELSQWWLLLMLPIFVVLIFCLFLYLAMKLILRTHSGLNRVQLKAVDTFIDKIFEVQGGLTTPRSILAMKIIFEIIFKRKVDTLTNLIRDTGNLKSEYRDLAITLGEA